MVSIGNPFLGWRSCLFDCLTRLKEPYYNEPSLELSRGTPYGIKASENYNRNLYGHTLRYAVLEMIQYGQERYPEFYPIIQRHFAYHKDFLLQKMQEWKAESPKTVSPLIPQIRAALEGLPPLRQTRKRAAPKATPETISLVDDDDEVESEESPSTPLTTSSEKPAAKKAPETILLLD